MVVFITLEFSFCAGWTSLRIFVNKNCKKTSTVSFFFLTNQKGSVVLILLSLQNNSTGSMLTNNDALGAEIRELKARVVAPENAPKILQLPVPINL